MSRLDLEHEERERKSRFRDIERELDEELDMESTEALESGRSTATSGGITLTQIALAIVGVFVGIAVLGWLIPIVFRLAIWAVIILGILWLVGKLTGFGKNR